MLRSRTNARFLPGVSFPPGVEPTSDLAAALTGVQGVLVVVPSHVLYQVMANIQPLVQGPLEVLVATKGFQENTAKLPHDVVRECLGEGMAMGVLSGPTFAGELARGMPTAVTLAAADLVRAEEMANWLRDESFRVYTSEDVVGVELGGATKNVFAIAAGIADGLGFGANARAALVTRALAEMMRLGEACGGRRETFMGLAGVGDLVLTCTDDQSRNRRFGLALGGGRSMDQALAEIGQVVEGVRSAREVHRLAVRHGVDTPIVEQVYAVLYEGRRPQDAVRQLLQREQKPESV
jgi:glycerol-3-phosphate dehydrogenase (NAD(P)+)